LAEPTATCGPPINKCAGAKNRLISGDQPLSRLNLEAHKSPNCVKQSAFPILCLIGSQLYALLAGSSGQLQGKRKIFPSKLAGS
jgi:hypothetical protein